MIASRTPRLTILALKTLSLHLSALARTRWDRAAIFRAAKLSPKALLATVTQSCILDLHSIRWLTKLPKKTA
jgi:hypothetical protein